jgi:hypothetical protein
MKILNFDIFRKGKLDGKLLTTVILLFFVLLLGVANASAVECPNGFKWVRMSGVGCVQENCMEIENAKLSYTSSCICIDGYKGCYEPVDYTGFDKSKCGPFCPASRLITCVKPGDSCPGETTPPVLTPVPTATISPTPTAKVEKLDKTSCKDFGVDPKDFDLTYDNKMLRKEFMDFLKDYGSKHKLKSASKKYAGSNPLNQRREYLEEIGYFFFATNIEEVKDSKFMTGKENELGKRIDERFKKEGRPLTPAEIFEESLKINDNYVLDSLLTSHNYLKQAAYDFREPKTKEWNDNYNLKKKRIEELETKLEGKGVLDPFGQIIESQYLDEDAQKMIKQLDKYKKEVEELENFRENAEMKYKRLKQLRKKEDNEGAWYHLFITLSMGYVVPEVTNNWWGSSAYVRAVIWGEHRIYKGIIEWKDYDKVEYCWDVWGGYLGGEIYSTLWDNQEKVKKKIKENHEQWRGSVWEKNPGYIQNAYTGQKIYE